MFIPKQYGQSKIDKCPFCDKQATTKNKQGIPVCSTHSTRELEDLKCACGNYLDIKEGKFGVFFTCINCGCINLRKALEINSTLKMNSNFVKNNKNNNSHIIKNNSRTNNSSSKKQRIIYINSDDPDYFN